MDKPQDQDREMKMRFLAATTISGIYFILFTAFSISLLFKFKLKLEWRFYFVMFFSFVFFLFQYLQYQVSFLQASNSCDNNFPNCASDFVRLMICLNFINEMVNYLIQAYYVFQMQFVRIVLSQIRGRRLVEELTKFRIIKMMVLSIYAASFLGCTFFFWREVYFMYDDSNNVVILMIASLFKAVNLISKMILCYYLIRSTMFFISERKKLLKQRGMSFSFYNLAMIMLVTFLFMIEVVAKTLMDVRMLIYMWETTYKANDLFDIYSMFINPAFDFIILSSFIYLFYLVGKVNGKGKILNQDNKSFSTPVPQTAEIDENYLS